MTYEFGPFRADSRERVRFHQWIQWHLDRQFAAACKPLSIIQDLPIGFDPDGADAWIWQETTAHGVSVGAWWRPGRADAISLSSPPPRSSNAFEVLEGMSHR